MVMDKHRAMIEKAARDEYLKSIALFRLKPEYEIDAVALRNYYLRMRDQLSSSPLGKGE